MVFFLAALKMWMDQNFPDGVMRKLHIHGNKQQVEAATAEVEFLMKSAPVNTPRPGKMGPKVRKRKYHMFLYGFCLSVITSNQPLYSFCAAYE